MEDAVYRSQQRAPSFIVKDDYHTGGRQGGASLEGLLNASAAGREKNRAQRSDCPLQFLGGTVVFLLPQPSVPSGVSISAVTVHVWGAFLPYQRAED